MQNCALLIAFAICTWSTSVVAQQASERTEDERADEWIVGALAASERIQSGEVTVLDARTRKQFDELHVAGAQHADWRAFSKAGTSGGVLLPEAKLQHKLRKLGVSNKRPVLVVGDPAAWGEDGRIVWMLRIAGHERAALVDGGFDALKKTATPMSSKSTAAARGDFELRWNRALLVEDEQVLKSERVLDVRTREEYAGQTPYGESRGGHVPGARWIDYRELITADGYVVSRDIVEKLMRERGVGRDDEITAYCSAGVRSAFVTVVLKHYGYRSVRNYAGSMWEWSAGDPKSRPLVTSEP